MSSSSEAEKITIFEDSFGFDSNLIEIRRFTLTNSNKTSVQVITYGATVTSIKVADRKGNLDDVVLGFDDMNGYLSNFNPYFGATVGRVANRMSPTDFELNGQKVSLSKNLGTIQLHGGIKGFDKVVWEAFVGKNEVIFTYVSADREEGFPGVVLATAIYQLTPCNKLNIHYKAVVSKPTLINIVNHSYFNLAGHGSGSKGLLKHILTVNADHYTPLKNLIPTGEIKKVAETGYDLRSPKVLSEAFKALDVDGYDINFCVNHSSIQPGSAFVARLVEPESGRYLEVISNQPGVQVYTSNCLDIFEGKEGKTYEKQCGICFETQLYPNAIHNSTFPSAVVLPGQEYSHLVTYAFGVCDA